MTNFQSLKYNFTHFFYFFLSEIISASIELHIAQYNLLVLMLQEAIFLEYQ